MKHVLTEEDQQKLHGKRMAFIEKTYEECKNSPKLTEDEIAADNMKFSLAGKYTDLFNSTGFKNTTKDFQDFTKLYCKNHEERCFAWALFGCPKDAMAQE